MPRCLIADDSKIMRMLLRKIMENFGFDVTEAEDGEEVLEHCVSDRPDLIISDWSLPLIDGIDVLYKIRGDRKVKQPHFLFRFPKPCCHKAVPPTENTALFLLNISAVDIHDEPEISDHVLYLLPLVKGKSTVYLIRDTPLA